MLGETLKLKRFFLFNKSLIVFDSPRDVRGVAVLSHAHKVGSDEQWLYLPALKSCLLYTSPSPRDRTRSRMPSSA